MHRIGLIAGLSLFAVATTYRDKLKALQTDAAAQRQKLGLESDREKLYAQYPTPEITFDGDVATVPCGGSANIAVSGKFPKGTAFLVNDDDVEIADARADAAGWRARLTAAPNAAPAVVNLHAIAPVSGAERSMRIAQITGTYQLDLRFEDGWTAHFAGDQLAWKKGGESRTTRAEFTDMTLRWERSQEETDAQNAAMQKMTAASQENQSPIAAAMERMKACMAKADPERQACMNAINADMEEIGKKMQAMQEDAESARPTAAWGCAEAHLQSHAGALTGTATCAPHDRKMKMTGSLRCSRE